MLPFPVFSEGDLMVSETYPRNLVGYGRLTPDPKWPDEARVAVQFVINYEDARRVNWFHACLFLLDKMSLWEKMRRSQHQRRRGTGKALRHLGAPINVRRWQFVLLFLAADRAEIAPMSKPRKRGF